MRPITIMRPIIIIATLLFSRTFARILHRPREFRCSSLVIFGDSFSDDGVEADGESHGFIRNSNGPVWSEYANKMMQCDQYINFAYSGAKSGLDNFYFSGWSGLLWQVDKYFQNNPVTAEDSLVIFQSGGSIDFFTGEKQSFNVVQNIQSAITNITEAMTSGTLIVLSVIDVSTAPGIRSADDSAELSDRLTQLIADTNRQLSHLILDPNLGMRRLHPSLNIKYVDINPIMMNAMRHLNTTQPFSHQTNDTSQKSIYRYAYHDLWNPSTIVHYAIAKEIVRQLQDL